jgi:hypothetical protein
MGRNLATRLHRTYAGRTALRPAALPTSRSSIVLAKFVLVIAWSAALAALLCLLGLGVGAALALPPVPAQAFWRAAATLAVCAGLTIALVTPIAFFAGAGHGYLAPIGFAMLALALAQVVAAAGRGEYFPWAVPGLYAQGASLGAVSYAVVLLTGVAGMAGTLLWWERADQTR